MSRQAPHAIAAIDPPFATVPQGLALHGPRTACATGVPS